jgi:hypothetical protein
MLATTELNPDNHSQPSGSATNPDVVLRITHRRSAAPLALPSPSASIFFSRCSARCKLSLALGAD